MSERDVFSTGAGGGAGGGEPAGRGPAENRAATNGSIDHVHTDPYEMAHPGAMLSSADAAALDAMVEAGWDAGAVGAAHADRARRLASVLGSLDAPLTASRTSALDEALEDVVLLRVARLRASSSAAPARAGELCDDDRRAIDALVESGMSPAAGRSGADPRRLERHLGLLALLDTDPGTAEQRERRIESTLLAVQRSIEQQGERMQIESGGGRSRIQFADLVSVAALLLIGSAVLFSIMDGVRARGQVANCQTSMHAAGMGFGQYAASSRDLLPMASASQAGTPWWDVGGSPDRSNSANLFTLTRTGYSNLADLACAGNPSACLTEAQAGEMDWRRFADVSYSYRMMFGRGSAKLTDDPQGVLMSDRSTMVLIRPGVLQVRVFENSPNHGGRGQSVLLGDGSVQWMETPVFKDGDVLWLPRSVEDAIKRLVGPVAEPKPLQGTETPGGAGDKFVAP